MISATQLPLKVLSVSAAAIVAMAFAATKTRDLLIYNPSPSIRQGLYVRTNAPIELGAIVTVCAMDVAPKMARSRHFTGSKDRFIKHVAATAGDQVCSFGNTITINGRIAALHQQRDSAGRILPSWTGCRILDAQDVILLGDTADSFDSRYWGVISRDKIEGIWRPLQF